MDMNKLLERAREEAIESIGCEEDCRVDELHEFDAEFVGRQMRGYKQWYLKKNQPHNYFRINRIIPPGHEGRPYFYLRSFQVWVKKRNGEMTIAQQFKITEDCFLFLSSQEDWKECGDDQYRYQPQAAAVAGQG
jgi:hypothetical protein